MGTMHPILDRPKVPGGSHFDTLDHHATPLRKARTPLLSSSSSSASLAFKDKFGLRSHAAHEKREEEQALSYAAPLASDAPARTAT